MAFTQADIDALDRAIKTGVRKVKYSDEEVEYDSFQEMKDRRAFMINVMQSSTSVKPQDRVHRTTFSKGYR